jgi:hypothetical protein
MDRLFDVKQIVGDPCQGIAPIIPVSKALFYERMKAGLSIKETAF